MTKVHRLNGISASLRYSQPPLEKVQDNIVSYLYNYLSKYSNEQKAKYTVERYTGQEKVSTLLSDRIEKIII